jgi:poly(A) polymerase
MALHLSSGKLIDCMDSRRDLAQKHIRMVSKSVFSKDPVRLIRAYRLAAGLEFTIEPLTAAAIENNVDLISKTAGERIREELLKLLNNAKSFDHLNQMAANGLLNVIIPELNDLSQCIQNKNRPTTVWDHTLKAYFQLETLLDKVDRLVLQQHVHGLQQHMETRKALLKFVILLHDIAKPAAMALKKDGEVQFYRHAEKSADLARAVCKRLRFSNLEIDYVEFIIRNHLYPYHLYAAHQKNRLNPRALSRFYRICLDRTPDLLLHAVADFNGSCLETRKSESDFRNFAGELIHTFYIDFLPRSALPPILTGNDLTSEFNLTPSPLYKQILTLVEEERLSKDHMGRQEALVLVEKFLKKRALRK